ncbi:MAG TPA: peptide-methionine (S)-S-oxide reductase [Bacteroidetes bacterium]|nr:peptide-methionine (S)-S-oxide reductase [Bacteroidota bacterium]
MKFTILPLLILGLAFTSCAQGNSQKNTKQNKKSEKMMDTKGLSTATFGAGCFWCVEAIFQDLKGVHDVASGYSGGHVKNPTYREVCTGTTGHAEALQIHFDPRVISYEDLVKVLFTTHDPTTLNQQGADRGTQYRSVIFYHDEEQKAIAERLKKEFAPTIWSDPIVTEIVPFDKFYKAEDYHQNYYKDNPNQGYCRVVINPKVVKFRKQYAHLLRD